MHVFRTSGIPPQTWRSSATEGASGNLRTSEPNSAPLWTWLTCLLQRARSIQSPAAGASRSRIRSNRVGNLAGTESRLRSAVPSMPADAILGASAEVSGQVARARVGAAHRFLRRALWKRKIGRPKSRPGPLGGRVGNPLTRTVQVG